MAFAGGILGLCFFAKQTGGVIAAAGGLALLLLRWRSAPAYALASGAVFSVGVIGLQTLSGGWFWRYVYELHQAHEFYRHRAFVDTPLTLLRAQPVLFGGLLIALVLLALRRKLDRELGVVALFALTGVLLACIGFGTQFAHINAYIPGLFLPAVLWACALGRLASAGLPLPALVLCLAHLGAAVWDPRPHLPKAADRLAGDRLIERLRAARGEVLIPFHPYYAVMAGKPPHLHRMGVLDIGMPPDLAEKIRRHEYDLIVMDDKTQWIRWPMIQAAYERAATLLPGVDAPRVVTGAATVPTAVFVPKP
jgi:hypothetical protein